MFVKKVFIVVAVLFGLVLLLTGSGYFLLSASLPSEAGTINLAGLSTQVTVNADKLGIPSVQAANRLDAFRVLGYLHARDRLFQMELMRRKSAGRLAEIFGEKAVNIDKLQRDYQLERTAQKIVSTLPASQKTLLESYVAGVNSYIVQAQVLPPEFLVLNYRPDPWRAEDSVLVAMSMFQTLNGHEQDERMLSVMDKALPPDLVKFLTPDTDMYASVLLGGTASYRSAPAIPVADFKTLETQDSELAKGAVDLDNSIAGSNNWVVSGSKTMDGRAIIANDMHLKLNAPNIWYRAELSYAEHYFNGVTLPGLPLPIVGSNGHVAWGFTNATVDLLDLISLDINPENKQEYQTPQGWRNFEQTSELIKVKGGQDIPIELRSTIWGPVSSQSLLGHPVVIKWTALEVDAVDFGLIDMDQATSAKQAMTIINRAGGPPQNVVFADQDGHIAWTYMGRFPKRIGFDGSSSKSWADASIKWDGFIPDAELPHLFDPPEGFIATANNRTLGGDYPYILGYNWSLGYRAYRIYELLRQKKDITEQDMLQIQLDTRSEIFEYYRNLALQVLGNAKKTLKMHQQIEAAMHTWDGQMNADSKGIALLLGFRTKLAEGLMAKVVARCKQVDPNFNYAWREMETPLRAMLNERPKGIIPAEFHDDWDSFILQALNSEAEELARQFSDLSLEKLNWGAVNRISIAHPLSKGLPILADFLNINDFDSDGCAGLCVKVVSNMNGASERMVISPTHPHDGILEMPGGQSGHPLSKHYRDQQDLWQTGNIAAFLPGENKYTLYFQATTSP